jgi:hypothetical protein
MQGAGAAGNPHYYRYPSCLSQFGVERRWGFTGMLLRLPPGFWCLCGSTGTIFLPFCVLAVRNHFLYQFTLYIML